MQNDLSEIPYIVKSYSKEIAFDLVDIYLYRQDFSAGKDGNVVEVGKVTIEDAESLLKNFWTDSAFTNALIGFRNKDSSVFIEFSRNDLESNILIRFEAISNGSVTEYHHIDTELIQASIDLLRVFPKILYECDYQTTTNIFVKLERYSRAAIVLFSIFLIVGYFFYVYVNSKIGTLFFSFSMFALFAGLLKDVFEGLILKRIFIRGRFGPGKYYKGMPAFFITLIVLILDLAILFAGVMTFYGSVFK